MIRRELLLLLSGAVATPRVLRAQKKATPVVGFLHFGSPGLFAYQAAGYGEFTPLINRRNGISRRQCHELVAPAEPEWIVCDQKRSGSRLYERSEGGLEFTFGAGIQDLELYPLRPRRFLHVSDDPLGKRAVLVHE